MKDLFSHITNIHFTGELSIDVIFIRLLLAITFGGLVGIERERQHKPAGFRTYILVCFGAAIVSMVQDQLRINIFNFSVENHNLAGIMKTDLGRLGAQVVSGIGFLGAGSIIKEKGETIAGLTTAAGIWATGCVGLGIGWGFYNIAIVAIVFMIIIMVVLKKVEAKFIRKSKFLTIEIQFNDDKNIITLISSCYEIFKEKSIAVNKINKDLKNSTITFNLSTDENNNISDTIISLSANRNINSIKEISQHS